METNNRPEIRLPYKMDQELFIRGPFKVMTYPQMEWTEFERACRAAGEDPNTTEAHDHWLSLFAEVAPV